MASDDPAEELRESELSFEQSLARLDQIVRELEEGRLGLSESLARYEQGIGLLNGCHRMLEAAQLRIEVLSGFDAEGNPVTQPLDDKVMTLEEKADSRGRRRSSGPAEPADGHPGGEVDVSGRLF